MEEARDFYDVDFLSEREVQWLRNKVNDEVKLDSRIDKSKLCQFLWCYLAVKHMVKGNSTKVEYKLFELTQGSAQIDVIGMEIKCHNGNLFERVMSLASNVEVYPKTDGTVQMNFSFYGLKKYN